MSKKRLVERSEHKKRLALADEELDAMLREDFGDEEPSYAGLSTVLIKLSEELDLGDGKLTRFGRRQARKANLWATALSPDPLLRLTDTGTRETSDLAEVCELAKTVLLGEVPADEAVRCRKLADRLGGGEATEERYVTLDQAAALVSRKKRTLENYRGNGLPEPDIHGGGGKPHLWKWSTMWPWLKATFKFELPERLPDRFG